MILTKYSGNWIINSEPFELIDGVTIVSYRDDASVQEFASEELMVEAHKAQFPKHQLSE
jgi:hypothetical protein